MTSAATSFPDIYADKPKITLAYQAAVMQAVLDGKPYQCRDVNTSAWYDGTNPDGRWGWSTTDFRINPSSRPKKLVAWTGEAVLASGARWLRPFASSTGTCKDLACSITQVRNDRLYYGLDNTSHSASYDALLGMGWQWSVNGIDWKPCGTEVLV